MFGHWLRLHVSLMCLFDAEQAFVQSDLEEILFMRLPEGCEDLSGKVVRLNRSLYGLKQA